MTQENLGKICKHLGFKTKFLLVTIILAGNLLGGCSRTSTDSLKPLDSANARTQLSQQLGQLGVSLNSQDVIAKAGRTQAVMDADTFWIVQSTAERMHALAQNLLASKSPPCRNNGSACWQWEVKENDVAALVSNPMYPSWWPKQRTPDRYDVSVRHFMPGDSGNTRGLDLLFVPSESRIYVRQWRT